MINHILKYFALALLLVASTTQAGVIYFNNLDANDEFHSSNGWSIGGTSGDINFVQAHRFTAAQSGAFNPDVS